MKCPYCGNEMIQSAKVELQVYYFCETCDKLFKNKPLPEVIQPGELKITYEKIRTGEIDWDGCL
jgi:hypothetical protein